MIPAEFDYRRAGTVEEALALLGEHGDDAKLIAGGHSLLPLMKLRLATPAVLVDIGRLRDLSYVRADGEEVAIGALTRHADLESSEVLAERVPLLAHVAARIGDPQVRHRGTIGGSIAHGDPASDLPAVLLALRATIHVRGPAGDRVVAADDFFTDFLETALAPDEVLTEIRVPSCAGAGWSFQKFSRRAQDWAIVGVAAVIPRPSDGGAPEMQPGIGLVNMATTPVRSAGAEEALAGDASAAEAAQRADEGLEPPGDLNASPEFRRHLSHVLVRRALVEAGVA
jgi:carbon-monoxide dehydrogenase medium subunit